MAEKALTAEVSASPVVPTSPKKSAIEQVDNDANSTYSEGINSTTSVTSSIKEHRDLHGRTYHRELGNANAWEPNDPRHVESVDMQ
ncbi:hypothetical protein N0V88_007052 [Collariella sp. IMI 366227]|nr:hypothetical protein N0V88_007052 [Collariella sp. IMI 366227]